MTDLVARVLLKADGSGLVGQVRPAAEAVKQLGTEAKTTGAAMAGVAAPATAAAAAIETAASGARDAGAAMAGVAAPAAAAAKAIGDAAATASAAGAAMGAAAAPAAAVAQALGTIAPASAGAASGLDRVAQGERATQVAADALGRTATTAAGALDGLGREAAGSAGGMGQSAAVAAQLQQQLEEAQRTIAELTGKIDILDTKLAQSGKSHRAAGDDAARHAFGVRNLGQQVGDFATQVSLGGGFARAFSSQIGQMGYAASEMGGRVGKVGAYLVGPWGIALTVAMTLLAPVAERMLDSASAAEAMEKKLSDAATAADSFGNAQSRIGQVIDLTTGKLKTQNAVLIESIRLQAYAGISAARKAEKEAKEDLSGIGLRTTVGPLSANGRAAALAGAAAGAIIPGIRVEGSAGLQSIATRFRDGTADIKTARTEIERLGAAGQLAGQKVEDVVLSFIKLGTARNDIDANQAIVDALDGKGIDPRLKPYEKPKKPKKPKDTSRARAALEEFGEDASDRIGSLAAGFQDSPAQVEKVSRALTQLDDLVDDIRRKKPLNMAQLLSDAAAARGVIEDGVNKPFRDYLDDQAEAMGIQRLVNDGRVDEAAALKVVIGLERQMGPLSAERKDAVLATVQAMRAEQRETDILHDKQQKYLGALGDIRAAVRGVIFDGIDGVKNVPGRLITAFQTLKGEQLFDRLFDGAFRDLQDQVNGTTVVRDASDRMAKAVGTTVDPLKRLADAAGAAARGLEGGVVSPAAPIGSVAVAASGVSAAIAAAPDLVDADGKVRSPVGDEVVVTAPKRSREPAAAPFFAGALEKIARGVGVGADQRTRDAQVADALKRGVQVSDDAATKIGKFGGKAIEGAATGAFANSLFEPLAKGLGLKTSKTGAQIGGAAGALTGIPGADIAGSIIGSVVGGLFKKTKSGSVTLTSAYGDVGATGNDKASQKAAAGLAGSVQDGLQQIADQLGGTLGSFSVTLGQRGGDYRVNASGTSLKTKKGAVDFGEDAAAASAYALQIAIGQGAVAGLSAAVSKALQSSSNVDRALKEALGVQALEELIGGLGSSLNRIFTTFDKTAAERVRLARTYGLDLLAVEKVNAEERAKLVADTLKGRIGSLSDLLDDMNFGDLFEGSAADRRTKLLDEIAKARTGAMAGEEGAADTLAALLRTIQGTSREAFGTAGPEYGADLALAKSAAEAVIKAETDRVNIAAGLQATATSAAVEAVKLADESNDLLAQLVAASNEQRRQLAALTDAVVKMPGGASVSSGYVTVRVADL